MNEVKINQLYNALLHKSLTNQSATNSGAIFVVHQKEDFSDNGVRGYIVRNEANLILQTENNSHFTPNVYRTATYSNSEHTHIKGFEERNLKQINTFVVDIDTHKHSISNILLTCLDNSIGVPSFIVKSPRGYQLYFVLTEPLFISNRNNFQGLTVAKRISRNLKKSLQSIDADIFCNDFGFFRMPSKENVVWSNLYQTYTMQHFIKWSSTYDEGQPLYQKQIEPTLTFHQEWLEALLQMDNVKGQKGQIGRNNALFTMGLVCYQAGLSQSNAQDYLEQLNDRFSPSLPNNELETILDSAYSGKYHGPNHEYLITLLELYAPTVSVPQNFKGWYKTKKPRNERVRSHLFEWEADLVTFIEQQHINKSPFVWQTQKEICDVISIPQSTLNQLMKQTTEILKVVKGKGRAAKTGWTTRTLFLAYLVGQNQKRHQQYREYLLTLIKEVIFTHNPCYEIILKTLQNSKKRTFINTA
ncbi:primase C-terminal domain-containing protein [Viridibacillus arvi]|uniref:primase C-terminal domain-containing protein n=1 Tax=Viridibacillus arvi TaxID=263475 RepID=UPI0034CDA785